MSAKLTRGRPAASRNVRVTPEFRNPPDVELLARAFISTAQKIALQEKRAGESMDKAA